MKLSPPASSSDLEAAREIARRLNRIALPPEPPRPLPPYAPLPGGHAASAPPPRPLVGAVPPPPPVRPPYVPPPVAPPVFSRPEPPPEPAPSHVAPEPPPAPVVDAEAEEVMPPAVEEPASPPPQYAPPPHSPVAAAPPLPPQEVMPPEPAEAAPVEDVEQIEEDLGPDDRATEVEGETESETVVPLTWPEVVSSCLALAEGKGALLINPEGRVIAVSGDWSPPGAEAIAARLVPAMDKALKDAPTRSVSVPLGGLHLTAWRAPMPSGLVTIGFVAEAPLRPELRPAIDATLKQGPQS